MARYEDEDEFDREDELEDEDDFEDDLDEDGPEDEPEDQDEEVIDFGPVNRQEAEAKAKRVPVRINERVYQFLPADQWSYTTWKAVDVEKGRLPDFETWVKGVLPKSQVRSLLALDMDLNQYSDLINRIQKRAEGKAKAARARARRSGDPRKRARSRA